MYSYFISDVNKAEVIVLNDGVAIHLISLKIPLSNSSASCCFVVPASKIKEINFVYEEVTTGFVVFI